MSEEKKNNLCRYISDKQLSASIVTVKTKSLTFAIWHAESIENPNVIHCDVSPALSIHQAFDHHLETPPKKAQSD